ncbi:hypothetical protein SRS16CHR_05491 [Variovorax sp. SRS16]|nr:hypothetical protein SRS16CHR_05491 [Variovorax sp. SRS16]
MCIMFVHAFETSLGAAAFVHAGYPFRGPIDEVQDGPVRAVQMKDMDPLDGVHWDRVTRTRLGGRGKADWLLPDDVLFVSRGTRFYAICLDAPPQGAVCGPHLFHLRVKPGSALLAGFLAWQINRAPFQRALRRAAEGSSQLSVRRPVLEALRIVVPPLADQARVVELARLARSEQRLYVRLIRNRDSMFESMAEALVSASGHS